MFDKIENTVLKINGGPAPNTTGNPVMLASRELYLGDDDCLYIGGVNDEEDPGVTHEAKPLKVKVADVKAVILDSNSFGTQEDFDLITRPINGQLFFLLDDAVAD